MSEASLIRNLFSLTGTDSGVWMVIPKIVDTALHLPSTIRAVCWITFWQWIGWAPFFFYGTTWVGETYYRQDPRHAEELKTSKDVLGDIARRGSLALVLFSLISFVGSIVLPFIVNSSESEERGPSTTRVSKPMARMINRIRSLQPDITTAWALSMLAFSTSMFLAPISRSFTFATSLVAVCGIPWAMTGWAPLAIMGVEINRLGSLTPNTNSSHRTGTYTTLLQTEGSFELTRLSHDSPPHQSAATTDLLTAEIEAQAQQDADEDVEQAEQDQPTSEVSGIYLGILNIFATIPQLLGTFISAIVFSILEPGQSPELSGGASPEGGDEADTGGEVVGVRLNGLSGTAVCLAIGAICSFVAAVQTFRLGRM
ncbi:MAG: hypothetical protein M1827_006383 [Pycnora praestabilis]|nr:MAG: hypothetical protein M1827_006383 [Pycnora praestabilis]